MITAIDPLEREYLFYSIRLINTLRPRLDPINSLIS